MADSPPNFLTPWPNFGISLAELSDRYLQTKTEAGYPEKTIKGYQDSHQLMLEILGDCAVDSLTHQDGRKLVETINWKLDYSALEIQQENLSLENKTKILKDV